MKKFMSGNQAVARGAWEAGVMFAAGYPGTPSTEILETLAPYKEVRARWCSNEKVAFDEAVGAAIGGLRAMVTMKHVGLNVASDAFMVFPYSGTNAGFVVISADDPGMHSSQNEQDNRYYARMAKVPLVEPSDAQECKDFVGLAFEISERFKTPVMMRTTTRIAHIKGLVELGERKEYPRREYVPDVKQYSVPIYRRLRRPELEKKLAQLRGYAEETPLNVVELRDSKVGVVANGISYQYARDVLPEASSFKLGLTYPLPREKLLDFCARHEKVYIVEEGEGFIEEQLLAFGATNIVGKELFGNIGEYSPERLEAAIKGTRFPTDYSSEIAILPRPPMFCVGCGHRTVFEALKRAKVMVTGDIGCYTMGALPPFEASHTTFCMGSSIGNAIGFEQAGVENVVAVIGDSTFIHAGIPGLIDAVYNKSKVTLLILNNGTTGMTGQQVHPGVDYTLQGEPTKALDLEKLARAVGVEYVKVVDAWQRKELYRTLREARAFDGPAVVIVEGACRMLPDQRGREIIPYVVDEEFCTDCGACYRIYCPAIVVGERGLPTILAEDCVACTLCQQVCPKDAIEVLVQ
ncbi:MAG: indolepyruvate ferredoxin oxidoreductase subunit alpha [Anaerolineae bacterium]